MKEIYEDKMQQLRLFLCTPTTLKDSSLLSTSLYNILKELKSRK
jgi:hypothetical protein